MRHGKPQKMDEIDLKLQYDHDGRVIITFTHTDNFDIMQKALGQFIESAKSGLTLEKSWEMSGGGSVGRTGYKIEPKEIVI